MQGQYLNPHRSEKHCNKFRPKACFLLLECSMETNLKDDLLSYAYPVTFRTQEIVNPNGMFVLKSGKIYCLKAGLENTIHKPEKIAVISRRHHSFPVEMCGNSIPMTPVTVSH